MTTRTTFSALLLLLGAALFAVTLSMFPTDARAVSYGVLSSSGAVTTLNSQCTGAVINHVMTRTGAPPGPSENATNWTLLNSTANLPANYTNGNYCIQSAKQLCIQTGTGLNFGFDCSQWSVVYTVHSGSGRTTNNGGTGQAAISRSTLVYNPPPPVPTVTLSASPTSIAYGASSALTWSSTNATSCTGSGTGFATGNATSGTDSVSPTATTNYTVTCTGAGGSGSANRTVTVAPPPTSATLTANPTSVPVNGSATLSWSSLSAEYCVGLGFETNGNPSGSVSTGALTSTRTYSVTCYEQGPGSGVSYENSTWVEFGDIPEAWSANYQACPYSNPVGMACDGTPTICRGDTSANEEGYDNTAFICPPTSNSGPSGDTASASRTVTVSSQSNLRAGSITPTSATAGTAVTLSSTISNTGAGSSGAGFWNRFQRATSAAGANTTYIGVFNRTSALAAGGTFAATLSYTFPSAATWYVRACADHNASGTGAITESNESDNCGSWTAVVVSEPSYQCSDGIDNDGDGKIDHPDDLGCTEPDDSSENSDPLQPDLTLSGTVTPTSATLNTPVVLSGTILNNGNAATGAGFWNLFQRATDVSGTGAIDIGTWQRTTSLSHTSGSNTAVAGLSYTFTSMPPSGSEWFVRVCADKNAAASAGTITESNEGNNCGGWTAITLGVPPQCSDGTDNDSDGEVDYPDDLGCSSAGDTSENSENENPPTATLSGSTGSITYGDSVTLTWDSENAVSCVGTNFSTGGATSNNEGVVLSPTETTTYTLDCVDSFGVHTYSNQTITVNAPELSLTATDLAVRPGGTTTIIWSVLDGDVDSCTIVGPGLSANTTSGSQVVTITQSSTYTMTCVSGPFNPTTSITISILPAFGEE